MLQHFTGVTEEQYFESDEDSEVMTGLKSFVASLVKTYGMRFFYRDPELRDIDGAIIARLTILYLDGKPSTDPRRRGAFSFCVSRLTQKTFYIDGEHFIHRNPGYASVYVGFGGDLNVDVEKTRTRVRGAKLVDEFSHSMRDIRQTTFTTEILDLLGPDSAYYDFPVPKGSDFMLMDDETLNTYISVNLGPRMLFDTDGLVTPMILQKIIDHCDTQGLDLLMEIVLLHQIHPYISTCTIDTRACAMAALVTDDVFTTQAIERYGNAFRVIRQPPDRLAQIFGFPLVSLSIDARMALIDGVLDENGSIDLDTLTARTRHIVDSSITHMSDVLGVVEIVVLSPNYRDYAPIDIFMYSSGESLYVVTTDQLPFIAVGAGTGVDEYIAEAGHTRWEYVKDSLLIDPPLPITDAVKYYVLSPPGDIIKVLNNSRPHSHFYSHQHQKGEMNINTKGKQTADAA